jgi:mRNA interferase MazF
MARNGTCRKGDLVKQGEIIKLDLNPTMGHEQSGYRPVLVVSNDCFNQRTNLALVCPISGTKNGFPLHVELDSRTKTQGEIRCEQIKAIDPQARKYVFVETVPKNILQEVVDIVYGSIEIVGK